MALLYKVARFLQLAGMVMLPAAVAGEVAGKLTLKEELMVAGAGLVLFFAGWLLQQMVKPPSG